MTWDEQSDHTNSSQKLRPDEPLRRNANTPLKNPKIATFSHFLRAMSVALKSQENNGDIATTISQLSTFANAKESLGTGAPFGDLES